jgi:hypothetical protein
MAGHLIANSGAQVRSQRTGFEKTRLAIRQADIARVDETTCFGSNGLVRKYRMQFLDGSARVIREMFADARNAVGAIGLVADADWPPRTITMRVLDLARLHVRLR